MFDAAAIGLVTQATAGLRQNFGYAMTPDKYNIQTAMEGRQFIYGIQLGLTYKITEHVSFFAGARMNYFSGGYNGFLKLALNPNTATELGTAIIGKYMAAGMTKEQATAQAQGIMQPMQQQLEQTKIELDCDQTGWGLTPIVGFDAKFGRLNLATKYEFRANMNIENDTRTLEYPEAAKAYMAPFENGVNTPSDIPSMLTAAAQYEILPTLRAAVEYHFFDDKRTRPKIPAADRNTTTVDSMAICYYRI